MSDHRLQVENLRVTFRVEASRRTPAREVRAVDGISLAIDQHETVGLVGESGSGKSSAGLAILRLIPGAGSVRLNGRELLDASPNELRALRREMQVIFQDPYSSLNPRHTIRRILREPLDVHGIGERRQRDGLVAEALERVGLERDVAKRFPHEFSGGQRQRIGIARALMVDPSLIVCDEPTSALDVSTQAQIITLLQDLQEERGMAYLFITHDLAVVRHISDRVAVMYLGRIVELADAEDLYAQPLHPYTRSLLAAAPIPDPTAEGARVPELLRGDQPDAANPPSGCRFRTRCPFATDVCAEQDPPLRSLAERHVVACHHAEQIVKETEAVLP